MPSVSSLRMDLCMTRGTKGHQVRSCMRSAFGKRNDVVDLFHRDHLSFLKAVLAERMLLGVAVPDPFPCSPVTFLCLRVPSVPFVLRVGEFLVLRAVPSVSQFRASWVSAWMLWFVWHFISPIKKPRQVSLSRLFSDVSVIVMILQNRSGLQVTKSGQIHLKHSSTASIPTLQTI